MPRDDYSVGYDVGRIDMYAAIHEKLEAMWGCAIDQDKAVKFKDLIEAVEALEPPHVAKRPRE